jgi:hypothetical protein
VRRWTLSRLGSGWWMLSILFCNVPVMQWQLWYRKVCIVFMCVMHFLWCFCDNVRVKWKLMRSCNTFMKAVTCTYVGVRPLRDTHFEDEAITPWAPNFVNALIWGASFGVQKHWIILYPISLDGQSSLTLMMYVVGQVRVVLEEL